MGDSNYSLIWLVLGLPLVGALIQAFLGKRIIDRMGAAAGRRVMGTFAVLPIAIAFAIGAFLTFQLMGDHSAEGHVLTLFDWISVKALTIPFEVLVDHLSMTMVLIITGVGALIHLYATGYMSEERDYSRFFTYLNLFISCMLILVLANNLALMFIGWEGVGLCSYLLIGFWYKDVNNAKAANKAFIVNRIGDWGLSLGMFLIFVFFSMHQSDLGVSSNHWLSYDVVLPNAVKLLQANPGISTAIALLLFVGACGKSAQFPLYFWLPDAMAGPTPVSALIHAATMVTAGVFMLNRLHVFFELSQIASVVVCCVGAFTALFAALIAFGQTDIKKVLAYSTVSQLGYMFVACGAGGYWAGMFHVTTHAFFKALLFLGAGAVIHAMAHNQDMRNYGKLWKYIPITCGTMVVGWLAISGFPLLSGFWSKEAILGSAFGNTQAVTDQANFSVICGWVALFTAMLTAWYMTRMTMLTFAGNEERWRSIKPAHDHSHDARHSGSQHPTPNTQHLEIHATHGHEDPFGFEYTDEEMAAIHESDHEEHHHELDGHHTPKEVFPSMWIPLVVLAILSLGAGYFMAKDETFRNWLYPEGRLALLNPGVVPGEPGKLPLGLTLTVYSMIAAGLGLLVGLVVYWKGLPKREGWDMSKWNPFRRAALNQFGYDDAVVGAGVTGGGDIAKATWKVLDAGFIDGLVNGAGWVSTQLGGLIRRIQTGYVRTYALVMLFGVIGLVGLIVRAYMISGVGK